MAKPLSLTFYSDVLCIWAHIAQARLDEVKQQFSEQVEVGYRFCSVFGDTVHKLAVGWTDKGGYEGFAKHLHEVVSSFYHITLHPQIWVHTRPLSSTPAHLVLKAVQRVEPDQCDTLLCDLRRAFFEQGLDIGSREILESVIEKAGISVDAVRIIIDSGQAFADLEADTRDKQGLMIQGSPTFILNDGRQKLYGNVGYGVIESNIKELLRSPVAGSASWC